MILKLKSNHYQFWILYSPLPIPLNFVAVHNWLVVKAPNEEPVRWEVWQHQHCCHESWGHLHKNLFFPHQGISRNYFPFGRCKGKYWEPRIASYLEGISAKHIVKFIQSNARQYSQKNRYVFWPGPNSNTFVQWIINQFPEKGIKLPKRSLGAGKLIPEIQQ